MNILEKYFTIYDRLIIIISGLYESNIKQYVDWLKEDLKFKVVNLNYVNSINISDYNYEEILTNINKINRSSDKVGLIIYGLTFPTKYNIPYDIHINLNINKEKFKKTNKNMDYFYWYINTLKENLITYRIKVFDDSIDDKIYDLIFDNIINFINKKN